MNILSEMSSIYYELTISEKRIAEYILEHTDLTDFLTQEGAFCAMTA